MQTHIKPISTSTTSPHIFPKPTPQKQSKHISLYPPSNYNINSHRQFKQPTITIPTSTTLLTIPVDISMKPSKYLKKKFQNKKPTNYLNYTNPISKSTKAISSNHLNVLTKSHPTNSNSISINTSSLKDNNHRITNPPKKTANTAFNSRKNSTSKEKQLITILSKHNSKNKITTTTNTIVNIHHNTLKRSYTKATEFKTSLLKNYFNIYKYTHKTSNNAKSKQNSISKGNNMLYQYAKPFKKKKKNITPSMKISNKKGTTYLVYKNKLAFPNRNIVASVMNKQITNYKNTTSRSNTKMCCKRNDTPPPSFIINTNTINTHHTINNDDSSITSIISSIHDAHYFKHESELLCKHIKTYYRNNKEYPKTDLSFYKYGRIIGRGAFGKVNIGLNILTGRIVAIKSFNKQNISSFTSKEKIRKETDIMRNLKHSSITKILEMFESEKYVLIIMEYISGGNLQSFVKKRRKLNEKTAKILFKQIMEGIKYIHSKNIVHRDIKLENILIDLNNNIKICDFGVSKRIHSNSILEDQCGTPVYMAPEIIKNEGYKGFPVDIWSAGVSLYLMLSGNIPFNKTSKHSLQEDILNSTYPPITGISNEADDLLRGLLDKNPSTRLTVDEVLVHPWLRDEEFDKNTKLNLNKYHLFTNAEMVLLSKTHIDYRKAALCDLEENFTMENLITKDEENTHNANTRSIILAPFNTMFSENDTDLNDSCYDVNNSIPKEFGVMRYCGKIKELNLNYELNFNEEMDNGILINSQYDICNRSEEINNSKINESEYVFKGDNNKGKINTQFERYPNKGNYNANNNNLSDSTAENSNNVFVVNENIVSMVSKLGYKREDVLKWLDKNELNQATTAYYLLLNYESVK